MLAWKVRRNLSGGDRLDFEVQRGFPIGSSIGAACDARTRARARAAVRGGSCIAFIEKVAMLAWDLYSL
eukprot:9473090-Pyramimonas_sp.AAC.2